MAKNRHHSEDSGFTLIELLIVMILLGILAAIVLWATGTFTGDAKTSACAANVRIMNTAEAAYAAQHAGVPAAGDTTKLAPYISDTIPTVGTGAVKYDSGSGQWVCA
jgi:prepilin-type N-terminal cleavage/methylation domain-containing protein